MNNYQENIKKVLQSEQRVNEILETLVIENMTIKKAYQGESQINLKITTDMLNVHEKVHGGVLFTIADSTAGACCVSFGKKVLTLNASINYIKANGLGNIISKGSVIHKGNKTMVVTVNVYNEDSNALLCTANFTMFVIGEY